MLLTTLLSFLLGRKLREAVYVSCMIVISSVVSFLSLPFSPLSLSYPFYAYTYSYQDEIPSPIPGELGFVIVVDVYVLAVLGYEIYKKSSFGFHTYENVFCFSFFTLINLTGAILGYVFTKLFFKKVY